MFKKYSGSCLCGEVRYECSEEPVFSGNCHCRDCQKSSGSGYVPVLLFKKHTINIFGNPIYFASTGGSGKSIKRGFCASCGSTIFGLFEATPDLIGIRAGSLDNPDVYKPKLDFFTNSANHWDFMNPTIPKLNRSVGEG